MADRAASRRGGKSDAAFRTIREVSELLDVPQHVLRFWETRFPQVRPMKRAGGRRYYRPEDVALLRRIRRHLYDDGYTIKGVQKLLRDGDGAGAGEGGADANAAAAGGDGELPLWGAVEGGLSAENRAELQAVRDELTSLRELLARAATDRCHRRGGGL